MKHQLINNGSLLLAKDDLVHLRNPLGNQMIFSVVDIDNGYVVLEPLEFKRFDNDASRLNEFLTGKHVVKGIITHNT